MAYKYNPRRVALIWRGIPIQGFAKGSFITAKPDEAAAKKTVGNDGKATVTLNPNQGASIEFTLQEGSTTNALLSALVPSSSRNTLPAGDVLLKDLNGGTLCHGDTAWLQSFPEVTYGDDGPERKWMLDVESMDWKVGGGSIL